ncbi:butyrate kinase [Candidatus Fermentibacteria bacterium]|nr:butyrate kinase [Candidatus Fermentibacteria bacterium]
MSKTYRILAINPGSTSTKISVFENKEQVWTENLAHSQEELSSFEKIIDQYDFRERVILRSLADNGFPVDSFHGVVGRGGLLYPVAGGTYRVDERLKDHLRQGVQGEHVSNLGALIADKVAEEAGCDAFIVDPVVVDELQPLARYSGHPELPRKSIFHALNQRAVARNAAEKLGRPYGQANLIVAHMGGGITVGCHSQGRVIDVNNGLNGDGPFTPERTGGLPSGDLVDLCFRGDRSHDQMKKLIKGAGGIVAYLGTNSMKEVSDRVDNGESESEAVYRAMAYQVSKEICSLAAVVDGQVDGIVLTGGVANDPRFTGWIEERVGFLAPVLVFPGEMEMDALALGALRVLEGREEAQTYQPEE